MPDDADYQSWAFICGCAGLFHAGNRTDAMSQKDPSQPRQSRTRPPSPLKSDPAAGERLAAALRENLRRRKEQARGRKNGDGSEG